MPKKFIIGITGGSGVGKTTLIELLRKEFPNKITTFSLDNYYLPIEKQQRDENGIVNFDLPTALDTKRMAADFLKLVEGQDISFSTYNFNNPIGDRSDVSLVSKDILLVEGLFVMCYPFLKQRLDYAVYLKMDPDLQFERRLKRDLQERNYSKEDIIYQWKHHVLPAYNNYVLPYIDEVDLIITNNQSFDENINVLIDKIRNVLSVISE
ncbi:uridine kinase [Putridiphycobacter roseus]|uniref:Uridine kinase n=1 Tax=Putridiphycobacter roseus TaxID=2219161 RepID=A0A2W1N520_9FLAO|nr:AAA family ATPase [Putridiphycobacter roseus]PZE18914.1 uridine kinase [Putridiphycobacter roseus]